MAMQHVMIRSLLLLTILFQGTGAAMSLHRMVAHGHGSAHAHASSGDCVHDESGSPGTHLPDSHRHGERADDDCPTCDFLKAGRIAWIVLVPPAPPLPAPTDTVRPVSMVAIVSSDLPCLTLRGPPSA